MRQALHILRKDLRQFRAPIGVLLALVVVFTWAVIAPPSNFGRGWTLGSLLAEIGGSGGLGAMVIETANVESLLAPVLGLFWIYLIVQVVQADSLSDDRQFWLTRPYARRSLWLAKSLWIGLVVNVPFMAAQAAILVFDGLRLVPHAPGLLWDQVVLIIVLELPAAVLASITTSMTAFVLWAIGLVVPTIVVTVFNPSWGALEWLRSSVALAAALVISLIVLRLQFLRRRTTASRVVVAGAVVAGLVAYALAPWQTLLSVQSRIGSRTSPQIRVEYVPSPVSSGPRKGTTYGSTNTLSLAYRVTGIPDGTEVACEAVSVEIQDPSGRVWRSGLMSQSSRMLRAPSACLADDRVPPAFSERNLDLDRRVRVHLRAFVTVFGQEQSTRMAIGRGLTEVAGVGDCFVGYAERGIAGAICRTAFRAPPRVAWVSGDGMSLGDLVTRSLSYSPFPADLRISPVDDVEFSVRTDDGAVTVVTVEPVAHLWLDLELADVRLGDLERE